MDQRTLLAGMDSFNRVLCCRETFLTEIVREALSLAGFDGAVLARLAADIDRAAGRRSAGRKMIR